MTRELDAAVAEKVMGMGSQWTVQQQPDGTFMPTGEVWYSCPEFSTDMNAAWSVVEHVTRIPISLKEAERAANTRFAYWFEHSALWAMDAREAAQAICLAALAAVGVEL